MGDEKGEGEPSREEIEKKRKEREKFIKDQIAQAHDRRRRRARKTQRAINLLRIASCLIALIETLLAVCESNLVSSFFLFLTLSSTFETKPENVLETYCYYQPTGNRMCEDLMDRLTGFHHGGGAATSTGNHFPSVPTRPPMTLEESLILFEKYKGSFYNPPARFTIQHNIKDNCLTSELFTTLAKEMADNSTGSGPLPQKRLEELTHKLSLLLGNVQFSKVVANPAPPKIGNKEVPQVMNSLEKMKRGHEHDLSDVSLTDLILMRDNVRRHTEENIILNESKFKSLIQIKDFIRHRWKRSNNEVVGKTSTAAATETSLRGPHTSPASPQEPGGMQSIENGTNKSARARGDDDGDGIMVIKPEAHSLDSHFPGENKRTTKAPPITVDKELEATLIRREQEKPHQAQGKHTKGVTSPPVSTAARRPPPSHGRGSDKGERANNGRSGKQEKVVTGCDPNTNNNGKDHEDPNEKWKKFLKTNALPEVGPRNLLGLMEASLFVNWDCFIESMRNYNMPSRKKSSSSSEEQHHQQPEKHGPKSGCEYKFDPDFEKILGSAKPNNWFPLPKLALEMDIFSPDVYAAAQRRKVALAQIYHDFGGSMMSELSSFEEMPVSTPFQSVHCTIKTYTLVWHLVIVLILIVGVACEDKTALNIWGVMIILTSLMHFMIEDWINSTFNPEKTTAAIWFFVIYGLYKPLTILVVSTLASEYGKKQNRGLYGHKSLFRQILEILLKRRERNPKLRRSYHFQRKSANDPFFVICESPKYTFEDLQPSKNGMNRRKPPPPPVVQLELKIIKAVVNGQGNLVVYVNPPQDNPKDEGGRCGMCGTKQYTGEAAGKPIVYATDFICKVSPEEVGDRHTKFVLSTEIDVGVLNEEEIDNMILSEEEDDSSEDNDDDDEEEEDDDDDDDPDEGKNRVQDVNQNDNNQYWGKRASKSGDHATNTPPKRSTTVKRCSNPFHDLLVGRQKRELPSKLTVISERGPKNAEREPELRPTPESPPPSYVNDMPHLRNQVAEIISRKLTRTDQGDGLVSPPVQDPQDGLLGPPVLDGENPHI